MAKNTEEDIEPGIGLRIMDLPLPQVLDLIDKRVAAAEKAAAESKQHSLMAKAAAGEAGTAARDALKIEVDKLVPRVADAQAQAGRAEKLAKVALGIGEQNSKMLGGLAGTVAKLGARFVKFVTSYLNRTNQSRDGIMEDCADFVSIVPIVREPEKPELNRP